MFRILLVLLLFAGSYSLQAQSASNSEEQVISIYPNPTTNYFMLNQDAGIVKMQVFNVIGRLQNSFSVHSKQQRFDIADLNSGLYLVRMLDKQGTIISTQRINKR